MSKPFIDVYLNQDFGTIVGNTNTKIATYRIVVEVHSFPSEEVARKFVRDRLQKLVDSE
jgi:hypothetical protein